MNIPDDEVAKVLKLTVKEVQDQVEFGYLEEKIDEALDEAQAPVFNGNRKKSFLIIEIVE